ncbi:PP2C family serine/threonine-protein phosphatase [Arenimonas sp.]|uniref:PP2C family serine/threonine-protein phosphatase n=1 Tax=Arenimonas sp. TaxID=1872635 RepID=UPI002E2F42C0|nr:PP2C family serine/threonine-protein phosphatase [Arenimonas sp.]HEX4855153.1 PP2C family serine/threonine-protein phosphatase [Arenimonas sp.]
MPWHVCAATATGKSHLDAGTSCQDALSHQVRDGVLVAAVCDGAGSQPLSGEGAQAIARDVVAGLVARLAAGVPLPTLAAADLEAEVAACLSAVRETLQARADQAGVALGSYAATLVGVVTDGERGGFFHVGDGIAVADARDTALAPVLSLPENGEYANETYFVTGQDWRAHLRLTPISHPVRRVALMSDGAASFVMARGSGGLFPAFIDPVQAFLSAAPEAQGSAALQGTLADPRTWRITGDDKALLLALWQ